MNIYIASNNQHKIQEFAALLPSAKVYAASKIASDFNPVEDANTFEGNALIKARALAKYAQKNDLIIADDSGLKVDALNGAPSVRSARFAHDLFGAESGDDEANRKALASELAKRGLDNSRAEFVCALAVVHQDTEFVVCARMSGYVRTQEQGDGGFGYDAMFYADLAGGLSNAQLSAAAKNAISHRAMALDKLKQKLSTLLA